MSGEDGRVRSDGGRDAGEDRALPLFRVLALLAFAMVPLGSVELHRLGERLAPGWLSRVPAAVDLALVLVGTAAAAWGLARLGESRREGWVGLRRATGVAVVLWLWTGGLALLIFLLSEMGGDD